MITPFFNPDDEEKKSIETKGLNKKNIIECDKDGGFNLDFSKITNIGEINYTIEKDDTPKTRRTTSKPQVIKAESSKKKKEDDSYEKKFIETNNLIKGAIYQIDQGLGEIGEDIVTLRTSKNVRSKYNYLSLLQGTRSSLLSNKISAVRELNNTITKACELELRRSKDMRDSLNAEKDDNKAIMDMYQAFVNTPVGTYGSLGPSTLDMTAKNSNINVVPITTAQAPNVSSDQLYAEYQKNMTPTQHMMHLESNPNIQQVVLWNKSNGAKTFEIMDMSTGQILDNVEKYDIMFMEDVTIDEANGIARNVNLNETYPLIVVGQHSIIDEY